MMMMLVLDEACWQLELMLVLDQAQLGGQQQIDMLNVTVGDVLVGT